MDGIDTNVKPAITVYFAEAYHERVNIYRPEKQVEFKPNGIRQCSRKIVGWAIGDSLATTTLVSGSGKCVRNHCFAQ